MGTSKPPDHGTNALSQDETIDDLEALISMADYMQSELWRLQSNGYWLIAALTPLLREEIASIREGRPRQFRSDGNGGAGELTS